MAQIPRRLLDELTGELNALSSAGRQMVENAIARLVPAYSNEDGIVPPENIPLLRAEVLEVMDLVCGEMTDLSAARTAEFYDEVRTLANANGSYRAIAESGRVPIATEIAVNAIAKAYADSASMEKFVRELLDRLDFEVRIASNDCMATNAERDPAKPKYGRVPSGSETCGFCLMLASYGFYANSREAASHAHPNCDCRIVQSYDGMDIEGYNPDKMYEELKKLIDEMGGEGGIRADWNSMPDDKKKEYLSRHDNKQSDAYSAYRSNRIAKRIEGAAKERVGRERCDIPRSKTAGYALNDRHPTGKNKAEAFKSALGFTSDDAPEIERQIYGWMGRNKPKSKGSNQYGELFESDIKVKGKNGKNARVIASWIVYNDDAKYHLTSVYVKKRKRGEEDDDQ